MFVGIFTCITAAGVLCLYCEAESRQANGSMSLEAGRVEWLAPQHEDARALEHEVDRRQLLAGRRHDAVEHLVDLIFFCLEEEEEEEEGAA